MSCPCDLTPTAAAVTRLPAGLTLLPRQDAANGRFPAIRQRLLAAVRQAPVLATWRARDPHDLGVMLLEFAAYVGDVLGFYDEVRAHEAYLRTARLRPSLERLVHLIGYRPRPAVAASARVALLTTGKAALALPAGTGFRSGGFAGEPPQIFESTAAETLHPSLDQLTLARRQPTTLSGSLTSLLLVAASARVSVGQLVLVDCGGATPEAHVRTVTAVDRVVAADGRRYVRATLDHAVTLAHPVAAADVRLRLPTRTAAALKLTGLDAAPPQLHLGAQQAYLAGSLGALAAAAAALGTQVRLDAVHTSIKAGDRVVLSLGKEHRWFDVARRREIDHTLQAGYDLTIAGEVTHIPPVTQPVSLLTLIGRANAAGKRQGGSTWHTTDAPDLDVRFGLVDVGQAAVPASAVLAAGDPLTIADFRMPWSGPPQPTPDRLLLRDADGRGVDLAAGIDFATGAVATTAATWAPPLTHPVAAHGNVVELTRGETVPHEVLGSGDAGRAGQAFTLARAPLTYLASATTASGVASTLTVWVDGVAWTEVDSFFGQAGDAQVYVVRSDADGKATVQFGDGVRGARLPTGAGNVVARYRFGAGAAAPPAGSISQLAKPAAGVKRVIQAVAAGGGADREDVEDVRRLAPRSALLLGRAISIADLEACAAGVPGVRAAAAQWRWRRDRQAALAMVWYVGDAPVETVRARVRQFADPSTPIHVELATPIVPRLRIDVETDPRRVAAEVAAAVRAALLEPRRGFLALPNLGIGAPLLRSRLLAAVLDVPGALGVRGLFWPLAPGTGLGFSPVGPTFTPVGALVGITTTAALPFTGIGRSPGAGKYFDWAPATALVVTGSPP